MNHYVAVSPRGAGRLIGGVGMILRGPREQAASPDYVHTIALEQDYADDLAFLYE